MAAEVMTINLGGVNCFLISTSGGFILIDTGGWTLSNGGLTAIRSALEKELENAGCQPGNLRLILITHGHYDHTANVVYLRAKYKTPITMHSEDVRMVETGEMHTWDRKIRPWILQTAVMPVMKIIYRSREKEIFTQFERFSPDFTIDEGFDLTPYGLDAAVIHLPGHSRGSIGILTGSKDLFCGDILANIRDKPAFVQMADEDLSQLDASIARLKQMEIKMVYPGHGKPFQMERLKKNNH